LIRQKPSGRSRLFLLSPPPHQPLVACREEAELIPKGARWIKSAAAKFVPEENAIVTADGHTVHYNYLVVCPGIQINWDNVLLCFHCFCLGRSSSDAGAGHTHAPQQVKGLREALSKDGVCSNYSYEHVDATWVR